MAEHEIKPAELKETSKCNYLTKEKTHPAFTLLLGIVMAYGLAGLSFLLYQVYLFPWVSLAIVLGSAIGLGILYGLGLLAGLVFDRLLR